MITKFKNTTKIKWADELILIKESLIIAVKTGNYVNFYLCFRNTHFPYIPCIEKDVEKKYSKCFSILYEIGKISIPTSVALSMHFYVLASISAFPLNQFHPFFWKRKLLLRRIKNEKLLIANTGSIRTYQNDNKQKNIKYIDGKYILNFSTPFMSLAGIADIILFSAKVEDSVTAIFIIYAKENQDNINYKDSSIGEKMVGSYTKSVIFDNCEIDSSNVIRIKSKLKEESTALIYQRSWFQSLLPSCYLGAGRIMLDSLKNFSFSKIKNNKKLIENENFIQEVGQLVFRLRLAENACIFTRNKFSQFKNDEELIILREIFECSLLAKYYSTNTVEEIINTSRNILGTSFFKDSIVSSKVYSDILYGALQPMSNRDIINFLGNDFLNQNT